MTVFSYGLRSWLIAGCLAAIVVSPQVVFAQVAQSIEAPSPGSLLVQPSYLSGWAFDWRGTADSGIDAIHVYATGPIGTAVLLGAAQLGIPRPDLGAAYGPARANAGYQFLLNGLPPGSYQLGTMIYSRYAGWTGPYVTSFVVPAAPVVVIDASPGGAQPFVLTGAAGDLYGPAPGVSEVRMYARPTGGAEIFLGNALMGLARPDMAQQYGARYANSGWSFTVRGLAPNTYQLTARAFNPSTGQWGAAVTNLSVTNSVAVLIDSPPNNTPQAQPFNVSGAAGDLAAASGTGVSQVYVYAVKNGVTVAGQYATYGTPRPDLAAQYGSQFMNVGFYAQVAGLAPGTYQFWVYAYSTVSSTWSQAYVTTANVDLYAPVPQINAPSGVYEGFVGVVFLNKPPDTQIRYTWDGTTPTEASTLWVKPPYGLDDLVIPISGTFKFRSFKAGVFPSAAETRTYVVNPRTQAGDPYVSPGSGSYSEPQVVLAATSYGEDIYYTLDGT